MADELKNLRQEIDRIDDALVESLNRRAELARKIGALKANGAAYRPERETEILRKVSRTRGVLSGARLTAVFREIISACRGLEEALERIRSSADIERSESIVVLSNLIERTRP